MESHINQVSIGVDIGGTNSKFGILNRSGEILIEYSLSTRSFADPKDLILQMRTNLAPHLEGYELVGIGVGAPNGNSLTGNIEHAPNLTWKGIVPLADYFSDIFQIPRERVRVDNDANAAAMGEFLFGVTKGNPHFVTITLGTGLGSGVIVDGKMVYGHDGMAGEYGHFRVIPNGRQCGCGRKGCLETYVSATGVQRSVQELASPNKEKSALSKMNNPTSKQIYELAEEGDLFAQEIIEFTIQTLGNALADFAVFSSPKTYVLFGGLAYMGESFAKRVRQVMEENLLIIYKGKIDIKISALQDKNAAVMGAAALGFH